jgi:hypothetical protein
MPVGAHPPSPWRSGARSRSSRCRGRWTMTCRSRPGAWPSWPTSWSPRGWSTITCHEGLRVLLHEEGVSFQRLTTWKQSHDPDFEAKKNRILHLYGSWMAPTTSSPATRRGPLRRRVRAAQPPAPSRPPLAVQGGGGAQPRRRRRATYTRPTLHPGWHRSPLPPRPGQHDPPLHRLAEPQRPRPPIPENRQQGKGCLTRH